MSLNTVTLVGRIVKELDLKYTSTGKAVARFTLAVNRDFKDANGDTKADFPSCQVWGKTAEVMADNLRKGSLIDVTGRVETGSYEKNGQKIYTTDIVVEKFHFLDSKKDSTNNGQTNQSNYRNNRQSSDPFSSHGESIQIDDDSLPF